MNTPRVPRATVLHLLARLCTRIGNGKGCRRIYCVDRPVVRAAPECLSGGTCAALRSEVQDYLEVVRQAAGAKPVFLEELAWPEVRAAISVAKGLALLPLGATEQHGPHLPLNVDTIFAHAFCGYASARTGAVVLPPVSVGCSLGHTTHWPGTLSVYPETLNTTIRETAEFVMASRFTRLMLVNSHWGNVPAARCAIDRVRFAFPDFLIGLRSTFEITPAVWQQFTDDAADFHANRAETALMLHLAPARVRHDQIQDADDSDRTAGHVFTHTVPRTSTNGVTGYPSRANAYDGGRLFRQIGDALIDVVRQAQIETPPLTPGKIHEP